MDSRTIGFSLGTLVLSSSPKTCLWGTDEAAPLNWLWGQNKVVEDGCIRDWKAPLMLILLPLSLQGMYVFAVYFVMHNQLCWPTKASYTVEMSGHEGPDSSYQGGGSAGVGSDVNKSTQNLISAMEEVTSRSLKSIHQHFVYISVREERKFIFWCQSIFGDLIFAHN